MGSPNRAHTEVKFRLDQAEVQQAPKMQRKLPGSKALTPQIVLTERNSWVSHPSRSRHEKRRTEDGEKPRPSLLLPSRSDGLGSAMDWTFLYVATFISLHRVVATLVLPFRGGSRVSSISWSWWPALNPVSITPPSRRSRSRLYPGRVSGIERARNPEPTTYPADCAWAHQCASVEALEVRSGRAAAAVTRFWPTARAVRCPSALISLPLDLPSSFANEAARKTLSPSPSPFLYAEARSHRAGLGHHRDLLGLYLHPSGCTTRTPRSPPFFPPSLCIELFLDASRSAGLLCGNCFALLLPRSPATGRTPCSRQAFTFLAVVVSRARSAIVYRRSSRGSRRRSLSSSVSPFPSAVLEALPRSQRYEPFGDTS